MNSGDWTGKKTLLIGIGNRYRGDDGVGLALAAELKDALKETTETVFCDGDLIELIDLWQGRKQVFLIDAVCSAGVPCGFLHRIAAHKETVPAYFCPSSTHLFSLGQVIELARALNQLPERLVIFGIEGKSYRLEAEISAELQGRLAELKNTIENEIRECLNA